MNVNTSNSPRQQPDPEISIKALDQAFPALDSNRATGYAQLGLARSAKSSSLAREQTLLTLKYGTAAATHPRMQYAAAALTRNELLRREVAAAQEVLEANAPIVDANSFVVYGFVRRKNQTGIPGLTLALTDEQGNWLRQYGYACTDPRGYFELRVTRAPNEKPNESTQPAKTDAESKKEAELKLAQERAAAAGKPAESTGTQPAGATGLSSGQRINTNQGTASTRVVQLRVFHRDGRVLHTEARPVVAKPDTLDYRLIILGDEDCGCTPPPEKSTGKNNPTAPSAPAAPPAAPVQPAPVTTEPRVPGLKSYQNPSEPPVRSGQPLEAIRGIGPKTATKLRGAGVADVPAFEKTPGAAFVKLAGFDKNPSKPAAATKPAETKPVEKSPAKKQAAKKPAAKKHPKK